MGSNGKCCIALITFKLGVKLIENCPMIVFKETVYHSGEPEMELIEQK